MPDKLAYQLYSSIWVGLDWLYPPQCGGCGVQGTRWCVSCADSTKVIQAPVCESCGWRLENGGICELYRQHPPAWNQMRPWAVYGSVIRRTIYPSKEKRDIGLGDELDKPSYRILKALPWQMDLIAPMSLDLARKRQRGYNQTSLLTMPLALSTRMRCRQGARRKVRQTSQQVNLVRAFQGDVRQIAGKAVLLVDDVTKTGAILEACSITLKDAGATKFIELTLARADHRIDRFNEDSWENQ